ncbi:MAG: hypothetical protein WCH40_06795 [Verrucomicrobiales bacterium]
MKPHKLLKTAEEHAAPLERLDVLMRLDPQPGSAEEDELELLALLIDTYEKYHFPMAAPSATEAMARCVRSSDSPRMPRENESP